MPHDDTKNRYATSAAITDQANVSAAYVQAEVNSIVAKLNAALAALRAAGIVSN